MKICIPLLFLSLFLSSCYKYDPQYEGPYEDGEFSYEPAYEILVVQAGNVYLYEGLLQSYKMVLSGNYTLGSINYAHDKFAVKASGNIEVYDIDGIKLEEIDNTENVSWFDWHVNGETLYMLDQGNLRFNGPVINTDITNLESAVPVSSNPSGVTSVAVTEGGDVIFTYFHHPTFGNPTKVVRVDFYGDQGQDDYEKSFIYEEEISGLRIGQAAEYAVFRTMDSGDYTSLRSLRVSNGNVFNYSSTFFEYNIIAKSPDGEEEVVANYSQLMLWSSERTAALPNDGVLVTSLDW
ncbi:MAG: hypothetical protein GYB31_00715 [Bacteroidetes bacterium]|nr:hypothetical protein [Bacteroidota bacterium]